MGVLILGNPNRGGGIVLVHNAGRALVLGGLILGGGRWLGHGP